MLSMLADYMERGFLDNIIDMFRHDEALFPHIAELIADKQSRVRIGTIALVEELMPTHRSRIASTLPAISIGLSNLNPTIRADVAYLMSIIRDRSALQYLRMAMETEKDAAVREAMAEAIDDIET